MYFSRAKQRSAGGPRVCHKLINSFVTSRRGSAGLITRWELSPTLKNTTVLYTLEFEGEFVKIHDVRKYLFFKPKKEAYFLSIFYCASKCVLV
eukprot:UN02093